MRANGAGTARVHRGQIRRVDRENRMKRFERAGASERMSPAEHLVQHHTQREEVGARIDVLAVHLFGRHVACGADG